MALTNLSPTISACFTNKCSTLTVTDTTGLYNAVSNTGGWDDGATVLINTITAATISITLPDGTVMTTVDVLSQLPSNVTGSFSFTAITLPALADGSYTVVYTVADSSGTKSKTLNLYALCNVRSCVDAMWGKFAAGQAETNACDCGCTDSTTLIKDRALLAESLLKALQSSAICNNTIVRDKLLAQLQKLCALEGCSCS